MRSPVSDITLAGRGGPTTDTSGSPSLSVIVCSHGRRAALERCLAALAEHAAEHEVILVDSASAPPLSDLAAAYCKRLPLIRYVYEPAPGLSRARNRGVREATGEIVAFVDDDACVTPDWSARLLAPYRDATIGCVGGACRAAFTTHRPRWLSDQLLQFAGITSFGEVPRESRGSFEFPFGANLSFRRAVLNAAGGFDERLGRIGTSLLSGEEFTAMEAVRGRGWKVWLAPDAVVDHYVSPERCSAGYYSRRLYWEGVTRARIRPGWRRPCGLALETPLYALRYLLTGDRFYLYRATAEPLGHLVEWRGQLVAWLRSALSTAFHRHGSSRYGPA